MDSEAADSLQDTHATPEEQEAAPPSLMTALEGVSQVAPDQTTGTRQPRSLAAIDNILVSKTQPLEEDLDDMFEEGEEEVGVDNESGETEDVASEEMTSAQLTTTEPEALTEPDTLDRMGGEPDTLDSMAGDKENTLEAGDKENTTDGAHTHRLSVFPLSKMKRIMKMDPG